MFEKYLDVYGTRFSYSQKTKFLKEIQKDLDTMGMESFVDKNRIHFSRVRNLMVGNFKNAKDVIIVPYDTPAMVFWPNYKYYPQEGMYFVKKHFVPGYVPMIIAYMILLCLIYVIPNYVSDTVQAFLFLFSTIYLVGLLKLIIKGFANRKNYTRNSAGIQMALEILENMDAKKRKECAFVFMDYACTKGHGAKTLQKYLEENHKNPQKLVINTIGSGEEICVGFSKGMRKNVNELIKKKSGMYKIHSKSLSEDDMYSTPMESLSQVLCISSGKMEENHFYAKDTASLKDHKVDQKIYNEIKNLIKEYLNV